MPLVVIATHPIQYQAPVYRALQHQQRVPVTVLYGSDFSLVGYRDREFDATIAWDTDLRSGYTARFLHRVAAGGARRAEAVSARGLGQALREAAPSAILLVGYGTPFHRAAIRHALRAGAPILFRGETTDHAVGRAPWKAALRDTMLRWLYRRCARLLYVGTRSRQHFTRLGCPASRLVFSPYGVATDAFQLDEPAREALRGATRRRLGLADSQRLLLFAGKLSPRKGPDLLLAAVKALPTGLRASCVVATLGDGALREALARQAADAPGVPLHPLGFQNQTALSQWYHAADLLVLPSRAGETWGLVVNEALHHGVPCVVSGAVGCAPDLVEPGVTGEVAAAPTGLDVAAALERAWPLIGRAEVRQACRQKVSAYSVDRAAEGIAQAYRAVTPP